MLTCSRCAPLALLIALLAFAGCDTNNPNTALSELQGVYDFEELRFVSETPALRPANVMERLDASQSSVEVFAEGPALLRFDLGNGLRRADLEASASRSRLTLTARTRGDQEAVRRLLMPASLTLTREGDRTLTAEISRTDVDLEAYDSEFYAGQDSEDGVLYVTLRRP